MKKLIAFVLVLTMVLSLCSCSEPVLPNPPVSEESSSVPEEPTPEIDPEQKYWEENMPKMDGSTSLIPLEAAIRSALLNISTEEATAQVVHSTTHGSFYNLLNEAVDLIFSVPISEQQAQIAAERNIELEHIPIAKEGFVFVVNANNPVDGLTQEQLRDIYSGKITNWKEVGGNDEEIIAYQRNQDSGSQNYMTTFMGDTPLMDAPTDLRPASMSGLMDVIAVNDYAEQSIGYSVYAYAADMYGNGDEIKFLAIDGVSPSKVTMAAGEYPLLSDNYAIFRADEPKDSPVSKLCDWMVSDEGQTAFAKAGYVTVRDIGFDYSNSEASAPVPYEGVGSGYLKEWDMPVFTCIAATAETINNYNHYYYGFGATLPLKVTLPENIPEKKEYGELSPFTTGITYKLECLKNKELQDKINNFIAEAVKNADDRSEELLNYLERIRTGDFSPYNQMMDWSVMENGYPSAIVHVKAQNGYIWATVSQMYVYDVQDGYDKYYSTQCRTWDMFTGEELSVEDLFKEGLDVDEFLNDFLRKASQTPIDSWGTYPQMKTDFVSLPESGWAVSPEAFYINCDNPYFAEGMKFYFKNNEVLCSQVFRDMKNMFIQSNDVLCEYFIYESPYEPIHTYVNGEAFDIQLLDETVGNSKVRAQINKDFLKKMENISKENAAKYFTSKGYTLTGDIEMFMYGWYLKEYSDKFVMFCSSGSIDGYVEGYEYSAIWPDSTGIYIYDLQTGKELQWQDLLIEDWEETCKTGGNAPSLPLNNFSIYYGNERLDPVNFYFVNWEGNVTGNANTFYIYVPITSLKIASELTK